MPTLDRNSHRSRRAEQRRSVLRLLAAVLNGRFAVLHRLRRNAFTSQDAPEIIQELLASRQDAAPDKLVPFPGTLRGLACRARPADVVRVDLYVLALWVVAFRANWHAMAAGNDDNGEQEPLVVRHVMNFTMESRLGVPPNNRIHLVLRVGRQILWALVRIMPPCAFGFRPADENVSTAVIGDCDY